MGIYQAQRDFLNHDITQGVISILSLLVAPEFSLSKFSLNTERVYIEDANWIVKNGHYSKELNGYYCFIGNSLKNKGESLFGFVGLKNGGQNISTFHIKSASQMGFK